MKDRPKGKSVLLFSGGMDSLIAARLLAPDVLLYVLHGNRYGPAEYAALQRLLSAGYVDRSRLTYAALQGLGAYERPDAIIPMRNLFFLALAAQHGERLLLGAMDGDRSLDKSPEFFRLAAELFDYLHRPQHWCEPRTFSVEAPFAAETKTSLVRRYLDAGQPSAALLESFSCYEPGAAGKPCGTCKPCFRKWVALANNDVAPSDGEWERYFDAPPWTASWLPEVRAAVRAGSYRGREDAEWEAALLRVGA